MQEYTTVTAAEIAGDPTLADWRFIHNVMRSDFGADSYPAAAELAMVIAKAAEDAEHHPDIDIRYPGRVRVALTTHATGGLTDRDVSLARTISALATDAGVASQPATVQRVELAIDTADADRIRPFWRVVLGYVDAGEELADPTRSDPGIWFQVTDEPAPGRNRLHVDIDVPDDVVAERLAAALEAGGTLVSDEFSPAWWVLADADGNEACLCTGQPKPDVST